MTLGWLDIHGHFRLPFKNDDERQANIKAMHDLCFMVPSDWSWTPEDSLNYMNKAGIQMQMLSYLPSTGDALRASNDYAASLVDRYPTRFGLLAALPTDEPQACLDEIDRAQSVLHADGYAVSAIRKGVMLGDPSLEQVWAKLDSIGATVFSHPNAYAPAKDGRPTPLIEVAFETCRVATDMLYRGIFKRHPNIKFVFSHCGGALPVLSGRLELLGAEQWVPNPEKLTREDIHEQLSSLYTDCAATAATGLRPAFQMVGSGHVVYGADCGVPCSTHETMERNRMSVLQIESEIGIARGTVGENGWKLFPSAAKRVKEGNGTTNGKAH